MKKVYVIESVRSPGSFYSLEHDKFKGWLYATKIKVDPEDTQVLEYATKIEPCKITIVYENNS